MPNAHDDEKWKAYPNTILEFSGRPSSIDLRKPLGTKDRELLRSLGLDEPFGVLTAENPCGLNAEDAKSEEQASIREERNRVRTGALTSALKDRGIHFVPVDGASPDGEYREHSLAILMDRDECIALARDYEQLAIFWYDGRDFWLYPAELDQVPERLPPEPRAQREAATPRSRSDTTRSSF